MSAAKSSGTANVDANGGSPNGTEEPSVHVPVPPLPPPTDGAGADQPPQASLLSPEELARRSGFRPGAIAAPPVAPAPPTAPGAYHVNVIPLPLGAADSVDGAAAVRRRRSGAAPAAASNNNNNNNNDDDNENDANGAGGADTTLSELSHEHEYEYRVAVAHLVEDAACELVPAAAAADGGGATDRPGGGASGPSSSSSSSSSLLGSHAGRSAAAAAATASSDGGDDGNLPNPNANSGETHRPQGASHVSVSTDVVVAEKLDRRSITMCGRHGRWQRWHCAVLVGLLLGACVVVPTAVVTVGGNAHGSSSGSSSSSSSSSSPQGNGTTNSTTGDHGSSVGGGSPLLDWDWARPGLLESIVVPSVSDPSDLRDANSPQSRALQWLRIDEGGGGGAAAVAGPDASNVEWRIRQRYALAVLYYSTGGDRWKQRYGFLDAAAAHECEWGSEKLNNGWMALECNDRREVTLLNLWQNRLAGSLPGPELAAALPALTALDLLTNQLTGTVPVELTALKSLNYLNLGYNRLRGTVPSELGNLDQITYLMVDWNDLTGTIPPELGRLVQLSGWLSLEGNQLHGTVPPSLANLTQATWIYLNNNDLTGSAEVLCDALQPVEGPGYTTENSTSPLLELWVDVEEVNCTCCNCCPFSDR